MAITQTVTKYQIVDIAKAYNRLDNFGYHGWQKLFDYMEEMSEEQDKDIELDIVGWCCEYDHAETIEDFMQYGPAFEEPEDFKNFDDEEKLEAIEEYLQENTSVVCCEDGCIIWAAF